MTERIKFLTLLAGLLALMNGASVQSQPVRKCYNETGNAVCLTADDQRDQRLKTWSDAIDYCRSLRNASLPTVTSQQDQFRLTAFLKDNDFLLDSVWLGGRGVSNGYKWTWMDGTVFSGSLSTDSLDPSVAAVYKKADGNATLDELHLDAEANGYICQYKGRTICNGSGSNARYTDGASCFESFGESINWFLARNKCLMRGAELATLNDTSEVGLKTLLERLNYKSPQIGVPGKQYWIGLRKIWWKWVDANTDVQESYFKDSPSLENLTSAEQNCLAIDYKYQFAWSIRSCSISLQTICQDIGPTLVTTTTPTTREETTLPVWAIGLISGLAGLVYIVSLIVVGVICWKCCRKQLRKNSDIEKIPTSNRRKNSYGKEPRGHHGPNTSAAPANEDGSFDGRYPEDEFDDYDKIEEERKSGGMYANHNEVANATRKGRPR